LSSWKELSNEGLIDEVRDAVLRTTLFFKFSLRKLLEKIFVLLFTRRPSK
jgi:hypothetical protein